MEHDDLIEHAASVLRPHKTSSGRIFGDVGAALVSASGILYKGISIDTPSWGICAERSAIATMATAGEFRIAKIVAVWRDESGKLTILPPCGICREFMRSVDDANLEAEVVLGRTDSLPLKELFPRHEWPKPIE